ncbi:MAG TPA: hypothetical protein VIL34_07320 [Actinopolymorphaceae bacterium]
MRLRIVCAPTEDSESFDEQVALVKKSGADYDGPSRVWWHDTASMTADQLDALFEAARRYGTVVKAG